jgi:hypothetical protein
VRRRPNTQNVQWFLEMHSSGQLDLHPSHQRRSVWNDQYRRFYVDTVLRDYPSPAIFLQIETRAGVPTVYHVIDGKQRLETLIKFSNDEFHLGDYLKDLGYDKPYFSDLQSDLQDAFVDYVLSVENISRASDNELKEAFDRLNRNVAKLNRQELRKAQYSGRFITKMTELSADSFWTSLGIATRSRVQRMLDIEFVSELYLLVMYGVRDGSDDLLDQAYADFDEEIVGEEEHDERYKAALEWVRRVPVDWRGTRWKNLGDFYSIWGAFLELDEENIVSVDEAAVRLEDFALRLDPPAANDQRASEYSDAVRQGTNKESSRKIRTEILSNILRSDS